MRSVSIPGSEIASQKRLKKVLAISTPLLEYESIPNQYTFKQMKNIKSILTETVLLCEAIVFWLVALPAAVIVFPAMALWQQIGGLVTAGPGVSPTFCEG